MRWERLFADLEVEAAGLDLAERDSEIAERTRAEQATVHLADRLRAAVGAPLTLHVKGAGTIPGQLEQVSSCWLLLSTATSVEWLVAWPAVMSVAGLRSRAAVAPTSALERLGWPATWRVLARDRGLVHVVRSDGSTVDGVPERAGADYVELRREGGLEIGSRGDLELVPYAAVAGVRYRREPVD